MSGRIPKVSHAKRLPVRKKAGNDLVGDHEHVVLGEHRLNLLEVGLRRNDRSARSEHRLGDEGGHRVRIFREDELLQLLRTPAGERLLALARVGVAIVVVAAGMQDVRDREVEALVHRRQAGERSRRHRNAVIAVLAGGYLSSSRACRGRCCSTRRTCTCGRSPRSPSSRTTPAASAPERSRAAARRDRWWASSSAGRTCGRSGACASARPRPGSGPRC